MTTTQPGSYRYGGTSYLANNEVQRSYQRRRIVRRLATGVDVLECGHRHRPPSGPRYGKPAPQYRYCDQCPKPGQQCVCQHVKLLHVDAAHCRLCRCPMFRDAGVDREDHPEHSAAERAVSGPPRAF